MPTPPDSRHAAATSTPLRAFGLGLLLGAQAAVIGAMLVVVPVVLAFVTTSGSPATAGISWSDATHAGLRIWLLAHGAELTWSSGSVSLIPLALSAVCGAAVYYSVRTSQLQLWSGLGGLIGGYGLVALVCALLPGAVGLAAWPRLVVGVIVIVGLGARLALRHEGSVRLVQARLGRLGPTLPPAMSAALRATWRAARWQLALGLVAVIVTLVAHSRALAVAAGVLDPDTVGAIVMILAQLGFLPDLAIWGVSFLSGAGFDIGAGHYGSFAVSGTPLPAVPVFAALPAAAWPPALAWAVMAALVIVAALVAWRELRRSAARSWPERALAVLGAGLAGGAGWFVAALLASGTVGARLLWAGPSPWVFAGTMAAVAAGGTAIGLLLAALSGPAPTKGSRPGRPSTGNAGPGPSGTAPRNRRPPSR